MDQHSILIVDDETVVLDITSKALKSEEYLISRAENADIALDVLKNKKIDLIITDQKMPGMSGIDFLKDVKINYPNVVTIMITGYADIDVAVEAINSVGVYKFLLKPWEAAELRITVKRALEFRHLLMERDALLKELNVQNTIFQEMDKISPGVVKKERKRLGI